MARTVILDQWHLTSTVPADLPEQRRRPIRRLLADRTFRVRVGRAVRAVFRQYPELQPVRVRLTS